MGMIRDEVSQVMLPAAAFVVLPWSLSLLLTRLRKCADWTPC